MGQWTVPSWCGTASLAGGSSSFLATRIVLLRYNSILLRAGKKGERKGRKERERKRGGLASPHRLDERSVLGPPLNERKRG